MKTTVFKKLFFPVMILIGFQVANAQKYHEDPKYGVDSASRMQCVRNLSLYSEYVKQKNYEAAIGSWYEVFHNCPRASKNVYLHGVKIFRHYADKEFDPTKKSDYIDTLMKVYDQRIKYFGQEGYVLGRKGVDFLKYRSENIDDVQIGYNILKKSIDSRKNKSEITVLIKFMTTSETLFREAKINYGKLVENYALLMEILEAKLEAKKDDANAQKAIEAIDGIFDACGPHECDVLVDLFKPKCEAAPDDYALLEKTGNLLSKAGCEDGDLYFYVRERCHKLKPSAKTAAKIAEMSNNKGDLENAISYFEEAVSLEENVANKATYYLQIAEIYRKQDKLTDSRTYARKAIESDPKSGLPYITIGHLYAASSKLCATEDELTKAVYWVAVDKYQKAKSVDSSLADEANKYIQAYSGYFPPKEALFFHSLKEGDPFKVGCWINETTTVRINE